MIGFAHTRIGSMSTGRFEDEVTSHRADVLAVPAESRRPVDGVRCNKSK